MIICNTQEIKLLDCFVNLNIKALALTLKEPDRLLKLFAPDIGTIVIRPIPLKIFPRITDLQNLTFINFVNSHNREDSICLIYARRIRIVANSHDIVSLFKVLQIHPELLFNGSFQRSLCAWHSSHNFHSFSIIDLI